MSDYSEDDFYIPELFDTKTASEGQWFDIYDSDDVHYGKYKLKYLAPLSAEYDLAFKRARAKFATEIRTKKLDTYSNIRVGVVECHLVDWELPQNPNSKKKPIPFSTKAAHDFFSMEKAKWICLKLAEFANEPSNFKGHEVEDSVEEISGN